MADYIYGIDISNNDGSVDMSRVASDGVQYVYMKATEGINFKDSYMDGFYTDAKAQGLKTGAYHFLVNSDGASQAKSFYNKIKDYSWDMYPMMDIETNFNGLCNVIKDFVAEWKTLTDMQLGVYTYTSFLSYLTDVEDIIKDFPFWQAQYNNDPWNLSDTFFTNRIGHQYSETGSVSGVNTNCDLNSFTEGVLLRGSTIAGAWTQGTGDNSTKWWYKHNDETYTTNGWEKINSKWYYFDSNGYMKTGWVQDGDKYYLLDSTEGDMLTGWQLIDNKYYYLNTDKGYMEKGFVSIDSKWYFLNRDSGELVTGWIQDGDKLYCAYSDGSLIHDTVAYGYKFNSDCVGEKLATPSKTN